MGTYILAFGAGLLLASRVRLVIQRLIIVAVLPLDVHGRVRVVHTMFIPEALRDIEASSLSPLHMEVCTQLA